MGRNRYSNIIPNRNVAPSISKPAGAATVPNNAGGYAYGLSIWEQAERWLTIGSLGGTYYVGEQKLTDTNLAAVEACIKADPQRFLKMVVEISDSGRALRNDQALLALALTLKFGDNVAKALTRANLATVARTGTHFLMFCGFVNQLRGWGRAARTAVASWYTEQNRDNLAYQMAKYQNREGWTHRDAIRLSHPKTVDPLKNGLFKWALKGTMPEGIRIVEGLERAKNASTVEDILSLMGEYRLSREMIPTQFLDNPQVLTKLFETMPLTAMIRNLGNLSKAGLMDIGVIRDETVRRLGDKEYIKAGRIHPISILIAAKQYGEGHGFKGSNSWNVNSRVMDALNDAFYLSMDFVPATGKHIVCALDVSSSMGATAHGTQTMTAEEVGVACILTIMRSEPRAEAIAFANSAGPVPKFSARQRLDDARNSFRNLPYGGGTDMSKAAEWVMNMKELSDAMIFYTDSETWLGTHPTYWFQKIRQRKPGFKVIEVAATSADTSQMNDDPLSLRIAGFDGTVPQVIDSFLRAG